MNVVEGPSRWTPHTTHVLYTQLLPNGDTVSAAFQSNGVFRYLQCRQSIFDSLVSGGRVLSVSRIIATPVSDIMLSSLSLVCRERRLKGSGFVGVTLHMLAFS